MQVSGNRTCRPPAKHQTKENIMGKNQDAKKATKKEPAKTVKEKKDAKKVKKEEKLRKQ